MVFKRFPSSRSCWRYENLLTFFCCWNKSTFNSCNTDDLTVILMTRSSKSYFPGFLSNSSVPLLLTSAALAMLIVLLAPLFHRWEDIAVI